MTDPEPTPLTYFEKIEAAPITLTTLLDDTDFFTEVLRGYPENYLNFSGDIATVYFKGLEYPTERPMSKRNRPDFIDSVVGLLSKGTKQEVHDAILHNSLYVLEQFEDNNDWIHLKNADGQEMVRDTAITGFNIYPERIKNSLITTSVINLRHDVRFRR